LLSFVDINYVDLIALLYCLMLIIYLFKQI